MTTVEHEYLRNRVQEECDCFDLSLSHFEALPEWLFIIYMLRYVHTVHQNVVVYPTIACERNMLRPCQWEAAKPVPR